MWKVIGDMFFILYLYIEFLCSKNVKTRTGLLNTLYHPLRTFVIYGGGAGQSKCEVYGFGNLLLVHLPVGVRNHDMRMKFVSSVSELTLEGLSILATRF
ncbi:hypothetical protein Zmor_023945 [Zophobas morio]|uniref:Uncharacterized protein n=1 Tax=Zophobas morio TaxID=2755281 RepID=A0AA38M6X1_9CUCU|nr:hypothetical protein Zmor_023945 [Zophobas morio]